MSGFLARILVLIAGVFYFLFVAIFSAVAFFLILNLSMASYWGEPYHSYYAQQLIIASIFDGVLFICGLVCIGSWRRPADHWVFLVTAGALSLVTGVFFLPLLIVAIMGFFLPGAGIIIIGIVERWRSKTV